MDPFVAEIRMVACNFAPRGWAQCNGQLLPISQNTALFSLLGTTYGGDGRSTFGLPDLQGRAPMHPGQGPGLSLRDLGEQTGGSVVSLLLSEIPAHTHALAASASVANSRTPDGNALSRSRGGAAYNNAAPNAAMAGSGATGGAQPHNNMQPYLCVMFIIALQGVYPPRS